MDQNQNFSGGQQPSAGNQFQSQPQQNQPSAIPTPPSQEEKVYVRSMESDMQSIKQSGGEAPQSQVVEAPELSSLKPQEQNYSSQFSQQPPKMEEKSPIDQTQEQPISEEIIGQEVGSGGSGLKRILLIVLIVVAAVAVGYGAYYLVSSLNKEPEVNLNINQNSDGTFPTDNNGLLPGDEQEPVDQPAIPVVNPLIHQAFYNFNSSSIATLSDLSLTSFRAAISSVASEKMIAGSSKEIIFQNASSAAVEASSILSAFIPQSSAGLLNLVDKDFTAWLYGDKVGGAKLGLIFKLNSQVNLVQASSTINPIIEASLQNIPNLFISSVSLPTTPEFKDGQIDGVPVRFLVFSTKTGQVFEYGYLNAGGGNYLVLATSYNQILDIVKKLKSLPSIGLPSDLPLSTATTSTTTGN